MKRIHEFEALRGLLALWVVVGHVIKHSGYDVAALRYFSLLAQPGYPVDVFIILSGFVIFNLLDGGHDSYGSFIIRRFFRLFPLFFVVLVVSALSASFVLSNLNDMPWKNSYIAGTAAIAAATIEYLPWQIAAHMTMLHGLLPDSVLPYSEYAVVGQAWSISVEWQFYLVAPLLLSLLRRWPAILSIIMIGIIFVHSRYWLGEGFAINQAAYFVIGIVCYFIYKHRRQLRLNPSVIWLAATISATLVSYFSTHVVSLCLWILFFASVLQADLGRPTAISTLCRARAAQFLGRISYSIYLCHFLVLIATSAVILRTVTYGGRLMHVCVLLPATLVLTIAVSSIAFLLIERPGMSLGRRLADKLSAERDVQSSFSRHRVSDTKQPND